MGIPIIFVHGIGASASVWEKFDIPDHPAFYISFSRRFADPARQSRELAAFVDEVLQKTKEERVILVCHSMGGLVARKYLADNINRHRVEKVILLSSPNTGSTGLSFNWLPVIFIMAGVIGFRYIWPLFLSLLGLVWEITSYLRGVLLLSPAALAMRPKSRFLRELNSKEMPRDVKYISVLFDTKAFPHRLVNIFVFREGGDGAIPLSSQKLSGKCVPNFSELNYAELHADLPHFAIPQRIKSVVMEAIRV